MTHPRRPLSPRQRRALYLAAQGFTALEAARELGCSRHTVQQHHRRLFERLEARSITHAVWLARDELEREAAAAGESPEPEQHVTEHGA